MQAIYASKLFKASSKERQEAIRAAIANPINAELVQQLSEYLDDDYREKRNEVLQEKKREEEQETDQTYVPDSSSENSEGSEFSSDRPSFSSAPRHADHHLSNMLKEEEGGADVPPVDTDTTETSKTEESSVEESDSVSGTPITSSCCPVTDPVVALSTQMDSIMGLLNAKDDSAGVRLVSIKGENELWIYYKDSVNLNNVMEPAIALLNAANYPYLNFNRLARTDNAIVFEIDKTKKPLEPIAETDEN